LSFLRGLSSGIRAKFRCEFSFLNRDEEGDIIGEVIPSPYMLFLLALLLEKGSMILSDGLFVRHLSLAGDTCYF
jgi:hypothetical protein